ncbi:MAG: hypothetical protein IMZ60_02155 [Actinobacteria bacterium]|nr:hypothetical protein [Actinomycetota bacterium]
MNKEEKKQKVINLLAEIIYELYGEIKKGNIKNVTADKRAVGKSARKAKSFQQTAFVFKE